MVRLVTGNMQLVNVEKGREQKRRRAAREFDNRL